MPGKSSRNSATKKSRSKRGNAGVATPVTDANGPKTAPPLPEELVKRHKLTKLHPVKHVRIKQRIGKDMPVNVRHRAAKAARTAAKHYKALDAKAVRYAKNKVPPAVQERIRENRAQNNGSLRIPVPIPKTNKKIHLVLPAALRHVRHGAVPVALAVVLVLTMLPAGAAVPVYDTSWKVGGTGSDLARSVAVDGENNIYTAGMFEGTVNFAASWEDTVNKTSEGDRDIFVMKQNSDGSQAWVKRLGGSAGEPEGVVATGGNDTFDNGAYRYHVFTSNGNLTVSEGGEVEYLIVGGGGGGGDAGGGGGGGGGVRSSDFNDDSVVLTPGAYPVTVGNGGNGGVWNTGGAGAGGNSSAFGITATGGGHGGNRSGSNPGGGSGGSGGGGAGSSNESRAGGAGSAGQGSSGGSHSAGLGGNYGGGGGGGATSSGENQTGIGRGANGGDGVSVWSDLYEVGGGGAGGTVNTDRANPGSGGSGGGGNGPNSGNGNSSPGANGTGGGGGGGQRTEQTPGGSGGSGIVVARYLLPSEGPASTVNLARIAADSAGNVYVIGTFTETVNFAEDWSGSDAKVSAGSTDVFVTKINDDGDYGWTRTFGGPGTEAASDVAVDASGNIYVTGSFTQTVTFDDDFGDDDDEKESVGSSDAFVTRINSDNTYGWTRTFGGTGSDKASGVAWQASGNLFVAGSFAGEVDFDEDFGTADDTKESAGSSDAFVVAMEDDGETYGWSRIIGGSGSDSAAAIVADENGMYVTGSFTGTVMFDDDFGTDDDEKTSAGDADAFVSRIGDDGAYGWTRQFGAGDAAVHIHDMTLGGEDVLYVVGAFDEEVDFAADSGFSGTDSIESAGLTDAFITQLGINGDYGWTREFGGEDADTAYGIAYDAADNMYVVGDFEGEVDFAAAFNEADEQASAGSTDAFIVKLAAAPVLRTITDAAGLTFEDEGGINLSSTGTSATNPDVYIRNQGNGDVLAVVPTDLTEDRDWSELSGGSNAENRMFLAGAATAPGASGTYNLYVPRESTDKAVYVCPDATELSEVGPDCENRVTYTTNDSSVGTDIHDDTDYFVIAGVTDDAIGAGSLAFPALLITETGEGTTVTEGGTGDHIMVSLPAAPTDAVTVSFTASPGGQLQAVTPVTFTTSDWMTPVQVSFAAVDDPDIEDPHAVSLNYSMSSEDSNYDGEGETDVLTIDIIDNDSAGVIWHAPDLLTSEDGDTVDLCVTLTARPTHTVTLSVESDDTSEVTLSTGTLGISPADWNDDEANCIVATGVDDDQVDGPKQVDVQITNVSSDDEDFDSLDAGNLPKVTLTNQDNDEAAFQVSATGTETDEADTLTVDVCIQLTARPASGSVTIPVSVSNPAEASLSSNQIVIGAANWNADTNCVTVTGEDDDVADGDVEYQVITGNPSADDPVWDALTANDIANVQLTNLDDDVASFTVTETGGSTSVSEDGATDQLRIAITSQPAEDQEVVLYVQPDGQLDVGEGDGELIELTFTGENWEDEQTVTVSAVDDELLEGTHTGTITIGIHEDTTEEPYLSLEPQTVNDITITDNDTATVSIATENDAAEDPAENGVFLVSLSSANHTGSPVNVTYSVDGTAEPDTHYAELSGSVAIPNGQDSAMITVDVTDKDNDLLDGNRSIVVTLESTNSPIVAVDDVADEATVFIFDDEEAVVSIETTQHGDEEDEVPVIFTVTLDTVNNTGAPISIVLQDEGGTATAGQDYTAFDGSVEIPDGEATAEKVVAVQDDELLEPETETAVASIASPSLGSVSISDEADEAEATITDNDTATVSVTTESNAAEDPAEDGAFEIALSKTNHTGSPITVTYDVSGTATPNSDYEPLSGSAEIAAGQDTVLVFVETEGFDDNDMEGDETVILTLTGADEPRVTVAEPLEATVTITDDETAAVIVHVMDSTTSEDGGEAEACISLTSFPTDDVTVTLVSGDDTKVTSPASVTVERDDWNTPAENCVTFTGLDDSPPRVTGNQEVTIHTTNVTSADPLYNALSGDDVEDIVLTHADNDTAGISVQVVSDETSEDGEQTAVVRFRLDTVPSANVTLQLAVSDATEGDLDGVTQVVLTPANWNSFAEHEITVHGVDDNLIDGDIVYELQTGGVTSTDPFYDALGSSDVQNIELTNLDDDEASVTVTPDEIGPTITEGGEATTHDVVIGTQPASGNAVVILVTPDNAEIDLGEGAGTEIALVFTEDDWDDPQTVTISPHDDALFDGPQNSGVVYTIDEEYTTEAPYLEYEFDQDTFAMTVADDETPSASLTAQNGNEEGPADMVFTVTLDMENNTGSPVTFTANSTDGTATEGDDYESFTDAEIVIPDGESSAELRVEVVDDNLLEGNETLEVTLTDVDHPAVSLASPTATATITDNDVTAATITATTPAAAEDPAQNGVFTVTLARTNLTGGSITVEYSVAGTATPDSDYARLSGTVAITNGQSSGIITVNTSDFDDDLIEGDETVIVTLESAGHPLVVIGSPNEATVTITDDDEPSITVTPDDPDATITEGGEATTHEVVIGTQPASGNVVVLTVTPSNNEVNLGEDAGEAISLTFTEENWDEPQTVTINPHDDALFDGLQATLLTYAVDTENTTEAPYLDYELGEDTFAVLVADDETAEASLTAQNGNEAGPADMVFTVTLDMENNTGGNIAFTANITGGSATPGSDFADFTDEVISVPDGESSAELHVGVVDDDLLEGNETLEVALTAVDHEGVSLGSPTAVATILDNEQALATVVATQPAAAENPAQEGEFTVYLDRVNLTGQSITVDYDVSGTATAGEDYEALPGSVVIANGQSNAIIAVDTNEFDDDSVEGNETVIVTLTSANHSQVAIGSPDSATVTIADDDGFTVSLTTTQHGNEDGPVNAVFTVALSAVNETGETVTVDVEADGGTATAGDDYEPFDTTVSIPDGEQQAQVVVTVLDDDLLEGTETIGARITNPSDAELGIDTATAHIADDETGVVTITASQSITAEHLDQNGEFTIELDTVNHAPEPILVFYTVNGTATAGDDYAPLSGTAMIPSTHDKTTINVVTDGYDDSIHEGDETVIVTLTGTDLPAVSIGDPSSATVTILDDDPAPTPEAPPPGGTQNPGQQPDQPQQVVRVTAEPPIEDEAPQPEAPLPQPVDQVAEDRDDDGIPDEEEAKAHNNGDGNGDGIPDNRQPNVASRISGVTGHPVTLEALGECAVITRFDIVPESALTKNDARFSYPHGLVDYTLRCEKAGQSANVTIFYDRTLQDVGAWRKFSPLHERFTHLDAAKALDKLVGSGDVTTVSYTITDGSEEDDDGEKNGEIRDPAGFAKRTFYAWDIGWIVPVLLAIWLIVHGMHHRRKHGAHHQHP